MAVSISLETVTGYDASYNPVFGGCEGAQITAYRATDGATGEALEKNLYTVAETGNDVSIARTEGDKRSKRTDG